MITKEELWTLNILTTTAQNEQTELNRILAARKSYIKLLEEKYTAIYDETIGHFKPKKVGG